MDEDLINRLVELEVKTAFQDELLDHLNLTVINQQQQLDVLQVQLKYLYQTQHKNQENIADKPYSLV